MRTLEDVAGAVGTPFYAYDADLFRERIARFRSAFGEEAPEVCYALKANDALALVAVAAGEGLGADIVSGGELAKARKAGIPAGRIVFSGVGKTRAEIAAALQAGVRALNVESLGELEAIAEEATALGVVAPVSVRLNPDVEADTHAYVATGSAASEFGLGLDDARAAYERAAQHPALEPIGISFHVGSQLLDRPGACGGGARRRALAGARGGRNPAAGPGRRRRSRDRLRRRRRRGRRRLRQGLVDARRELGARLVLEPGRWLVGPVGTFVMRVLYVKDAPRRRIAVCDGGMNDLIRPALYGARHPIGLLGPADRERGTVDVVGPVCESGDFFALGLELPLPEPGDLLAIGQAGAYCRVMSSAYNARPLCAEVLREDGSYRVIREPIATDVLAWAERL